MHLMTVDGLLRMPCAASLMNGVCKRDNSVRSVSEREMGSSCEPCGSLRKRSSISPGPSSSLRRLKTYKRMLVLALTGARISSSARDSAALYEPWALFSRTLGPEGRSESW